MEDDCFDFNYPLLEEEYSDYEIKIKQRLRDISYNKEIKRDIERHSDIYVSSVPLEEIHKTINMELLGPELIRAFGMTASRRAEVLETGTEENEGEDSQGEIADHESLASADDYGIQESADELVDEPENKDDRNVF